ncbi:hypothetical protein NONI108955_31485 [Nocardia ninae]
MSRWVIGSAPLHAERETMAGLLAIGRRVVPLRDRLCVEWDIVAYSLGVRRHVVPLGE